MMYPAMLVTQAQRATAHGDHVTAEILVGCATQWQADIDDLYWTQVMLKAEEKRRHDHVQQTQEVPGEDDAED